MTTLRRILHRYILKSDSRYLDHKKMPVSFADNAMDAIEKKGKEQERNHIQSIKEKVTKEQLKRKANIQKAQYFLGCVCLCLLAWYSKSVARFFGFGMGQSSTGNDQINFNTFDMDHVQRFPMHHQFSARSTELSLVSAGVRKKFIVFPQCSAGLYLNNKKVTELSQSKSLTMLSNPVTDGSAGDIFLAMKVVWLLPESTNSVVDTVYTAMSSARNIDYRRSLETFKTILAKQIGVGGMQKGESLEFLFGGLMQMGVAARGQLPEYVDNADLRRRLMNFFAGEESLFPEMPAVLHKQYLQ